LEACKEKLGAVQKLVLQFGIQLYHEPIRSQLELTQAKAVVAYRETSQWSMSYTVELEATKIMVEEYESLQEELNPNDGEQCLGDRLAFKLLEQKNAERETIKEVYYREISNQEEYETVRSRLGEISALPELSDKQFFEKEALEEMIFDWYQRGLSIPQAARKRIRLLVLGWILMLPDTPECEDKLAKVNEFTTTIADVIGIPPHQSVMNSLQGLPLVARIQRTAQLSRKPEECNGPRLIPTLHHPNMSAWNSVLEGLKDTPVCSEKTKRVKAAFKKAYYKQLVYEDEFHCAITRYHLLNPSSSSRIERWEWKTLNEMIIESSIRLGINYHSRLARENFDSLRDALRNRPRSMSLEACKEKLAEVQELAMNVAIHANHKPIESEKDLEAAATTFFSLKQAKDEGHKLTLIQQVQLEATQMMIEEHKDLHEELNKWMTQGSEK